MRKKRSANEKGKERKEKTNQEAASSRFAFVGRRCGGRGSVKKRGTARGVPYVPVREKMVRGERQRKKKGGGRGCVPERRRVTERGEGECTSQSNVGEKCPQCIVRKGGGGVVSQKKGDGGGEGARLKEFRRPVTRHKVNRGNFPKKCHVTDS
jgi:hypothetical protein